MMLEISTDVKLQDLYFSSSWRELAAHPGLARHPEWAREICEKVRSCDTLLASNESIVTCPDVVKALLKRGVAVRTALAENAKVFTNSALTARLVADKSPTVVTTIARRADLPLKIAESLVDNQRANVRESLAKNPAITAYPEIVERLASNSSDNVRETLAKNSEIFAFEDLVTIWLEGSDRQLRLALATNSGIGKAPEILKILAADESPEVRAGIASNPAIEYFPEIVEKLVCDSSAIVRKALALNKVALSTLPASESVDLKEGVATQEFLALRERRTNPPGSFDSAGRWYPDELFPCCRNVRSPSRAWPYSQLTHARTGKHTAARFGVDEGALRRRARQIEKGL